MRTAGVSVDSTKSARARAGAGRATTAATDPPYTRVARIRPLLYMAAIALNVVVGIVIGTVAQ